MMRARKNLSAVGFLFFCSCLISCHASTCTTSESIKVEKLVHEQHGWNGLYGLYLKYPECGTNNVVEVWGRYSEVIAGLLANHWDELGELLKLTRSDAGFKKFVLDHVADQTLPEDVLKKIKVNVKTECPADGSSLCKELEKAAE